MSIKPLKVYPYGNRIQFLTQDTPKSNFSNGKDTDEMLLNGGLPVKIFVTMFLHASLTLICYAT